MIQLKRHVGIVLSPSTEGFDTAASTFECAIKELGVDRYLMFYSGTNAIDWNANTNKGSIGLAISQDGVHFSKFDGNPILSVGKISLTPAVFTCKGRYWLAFAFKPDTLTGRRLGLAVADSPFGPWNFVRVICEPQYHWEGYDIDAGPSVITLKEDEFVVFFSNVSNKFYFKPLNMVLGTDYWRRRIGSVRIKIKEDEVSTEKNQAPLKQLNGGKGAWNESLFCPGYFTLGNKHFLLPTASCYSIGYPYKQYIGLVEDISPDFKHPLSNKVLIDGHKEKLELYPSAKGELALDTPCPIIRNNELLLYYAIMDRADGIWKTALSIFSLN